MTDDSVIYWIEDAKERLADNERVIEEQEAMIADMHRVINQCALLTFRKQRGIRFMSNNLQKIIERQLNDYSSDIDVWDQAVGDTFLTFGYRLSLQEQISNLTEDQLKRLYEVDRRVLELAAVNYENINSDDVAFLLRIADVIKTVKL